MTGGLFVCLKCGENKWRMNLCAIENNSTAFPANILQHLACPLGRIPNWEFVEGDYAKIPTNFKSTLSQRSLGIEAAEVRKRKADSERDFPGGYRVVAREDVDPEFLKWVEQG
jgi:hypothetical protein